MLIRVVDWSSANQSEVESASVWNRMMTKMHPAMRQVQPNPKLGPFNHVRSSHTTRDTSLASSTVHPVSTSQFISASMKLSALTGQALCSV
jgi:hypothetical protein